MKLTFEDFLKMKLDETVQQFKDIISEDEIVDFCKDMNVSIRSVELEENNLFIHYNYGDEAPKKYISDKNEVAKVIKNIVADYLGDLDLQFMVKRSNVTTNIGTLVYTLKVKK